MTPFKEILKDVNEKKVVWVKRWSIIWAGFNMIRATIDGMREILKYDGVISHVTLLSGQDYPIKPVTSYHDFLCSNADKDFITTSQLPRPNWESGGLDRILYHHIIFKKIRFAYPPISYLNIKLKFKEGGKWDIIKKNHLHNSKTKRVSTQIPRGAHTLRGVTMVYVILKQRSKHYPFFGY